MPPPGARPTDAPTLLDALLLPDGLPRPEGTRGGVRGPTWRGVGAVLFWGTLQGIFLPVPPVWPGLAPRVAIPVNLAVAAALAAWLVGRPVRGARRGERPAAWRAATYRLRAMPRGVAPTLAVVVLAMIAVAALALVVIPRFLPIPLDRTLAPYLARPLGPVVVLVTATLVAPLGEELLFRGWLQRSLERRWPAPLAIATTALLFAAFHLEAFGFAMRAALGGAAGYAAWRTRSIWPAVILHAAYNGALLVGSGLAGGVDERTLAQWARTDAVFWPAVLGILVVGTVLVAALRRLPGRTG